MTESRPYASLQFDTAGWLLQHWGSDLRASDLSQERPTRLLEKLPIVQAAIAKGMTKGAQATFPFEILAEEYAVVDPVARETLQRMRKSGNVDDAKEILLEAFVQYTASTGVRKQLSFRRDLWLHKDDSEGLTKIAERVCTRRIPEEEVSKKPRTIAAGTFSAVLVGQLCAVDPHTVLNAKNRFKKNPRRWNPSSQAQLYLVSMFLIGVRRGDVEPSRLLEILETLRDSFYRSLALYHLAKWAGQMRGNRLAPFLWDEIQQALALLRK